MSSPDELAEELEAIVDRTSLSRVLEGLSIVAHAKSEHLASAWQDDAAARLWSLTATKLDRMATSAQRERL